MKPELLLGFKTYKKKFVFSDLLSGLMVAIVALPLSIAFGIQSGATLQTGIMAAIVGGMLISAFGGAKFSIGGPSATFIVLTATYIADPDIGLNGIFIITTLAGVMLIAAGFLKAGRLLKYVPYTVIIGFTAGIGFILLSGQFKDFLGLILPDGNPPDFIGKMSACFQNMTSFNPFALLIGAVTLAIIYLLPKLNKKIPSVIIALIAATILSFVLNTALGDIASIPTLGSVYGDITAEFTFIDFSAVSSRFYIYLIPAGSIAILSALEGLMSASIAEGLSGAPFNPDSELIGHGIANIGTGLTGGIPVTGALARTSVNISSGAKSPLSGIFHSLFLLIFYLLLMPVMKYIPFSALAAVLIKVSISMSRFKLVARFAAFGLRDSATLLTSFLVTVIFGVLYGVFAGIAVAFAFNIPAFKNKLFITEVTANEVRGGEILPAESIRIFGLKGAVFFISVNKLLKVIESAATAAEYIVIDMDKTGKMDATAAEKLSKTAKAMAKNDKKLVLLNMSDTNEKRYKTALIYIQGDKTAATAPA